MKYNLFCLGSLSDTFYRFAKVNNDLIAQLSITITALQILHEMYKNISNVTDQSRPVNPRILMTVTSSGCLKLYLNLWQLFQGDLAEYLYGIEARVTLIRGIMDKMAEQRIKGNTTHMMVNGFHLIYLSIYPIPKNVLPQSMMSYINSSEHVVMD